MTTLTPEQRQEPERAGKEPVRLADPETQIEYVILKADVYDRIRAWPTIQGRLSPRDEGPRTRRLGRSASASDRAGDRARMGAAEGIRR